MANKMDKLTRIYKQFSERERKVFSIFIIGAFLILSGELFLWDNLKQQKITQEELVKNQQTVKNKQVEIDSLAKQIVNSSDKTLSNKVVAARNEFETLLGKTNYYVKAEELPLKLNALLQEEDSLQIIMVKNTIQSDSSKKSISQLYQQHFSVELTGTYQSLWDFINKIETTTFAKIERITLKTGEYPNNTYEVQFYIVTNNKEVFKIGKQ